MKIDFKKAVVWLKRNKINYSIENNSIVLFDDASGKVVLVFDDKGNRKAIPGTIIPHNPANGSDFYVKVSDWGVIGKKLIPWAKENDYYEFNHYYTAQWGTWKFGNFRSMSSFDTFIKKALALRNGVNENMKLSEAKEILEQNGYILNEAVKGVYMSVLGDLYETDDLQKVREIFKKRLSYYIDKYDLSKAREMIDKLDALDNGEIKYYKKGLKRNGGTQWIQCDEHGNEI